MGDSFFRHVTPSLRSGTLLARNYIKTYLSDSCHNVLEHDHDGLKFEKKIICNLAIGEAIVCKAKIDVFFNFRRGPTE